MMFFSKFASSQPLVQLGFLAVVPLFAMGCSRSSTSTPQYPVKFSGGHEIGQHDFGRPVTLIAAALDVEPDVFREAFSGVTPAHGRGPTGDEARQNKAALMKVLSPHGVTNERLDELSNYYRYRPKRRTMVHASSPRPRHRRKRPNQNRSS